MRVKDQRRFIISVQLLVKEAAKRGVIDLTAACYPVDFQTVTAELLKTRYMHYGGLLKQVGAFAAHARDEELTAKVTAVTKSANCGRVKRIRTDR